uniref:Metalloendopeptidase n=1 Tax=Acrobeloides nanus TaxID=290746 RepID=A0A914D2J6_9BILA
MKIYLFTFYFLHIISTIHSRRCWNRLAGTRVFPEDGDAKELQPIEFEASYRLPQQYVYLWPSINDHEREVLQDSFHQIARRTCIQFNELDYKPWYHADRWKADQPYVIIKKSKQFIAYTDNKIEDINQRSLLYITDAALNHPEFNTSRGMVMAQLLNFMGYKEELLRPDAASYIQPISEIPDRNIPKFTDEQLQWPFDPESVTISHNARFMYELTIYCQTRKNTDIGAGQRVGLLTRWDAIKLNSMYCPDKVGQADPRYGPCVLPRKSNRSTS